MTAAVVTREARSGLWSRSFGVRLTPRRQLARAIAVLVCMISLSLILELLLVSNLQQRAAQQSRFDALRADLAAGTAPVGPVDQEGRALAPGTPMAYLEIPEIGLRQVVGEGTAASTLFAGPGHRRDSVFPGQVGTSVLMGRRAGFGGPFADIGHLEEGDVIRLTVGQGEFEYEVLGVREEGEHAPPQIQPGEGRLMLVTAGGRPFMPSGVLRVDAELKDDPVRGPAPIFRPDALPAEEQIMRADTRTLWALALWLQALIVLTVGAVYAWHRWGRAKAWVIFFPALLLVGLNTAGEAARLMPNLL